MFKKKTLKDYDIAGKTVLLRADYNVPLNDSGEISSDYRITQSIPTIKALQEKGCKIVICSHLGRPKDADDTDFSLKPVAKRLSKLLEQTVFFVGDCIGDEVREASAKLQAGQILLLENLRFYSDEEDNDAEFAQDLVSSSGAEVFVQDGFGVVHRAHASTDAVARIIPAVAGLLLEKEVDTITDIMINPKRPFMAIIGGAKIADKIDIIYKFIEIADIVAIGGAMANTFLKARNLEIGDSLFDNEEIDIATDVMNKAREESLKRDFVFYLPQDGVVSTEIDSKTKTRIVDWDANVIAEIESYPAKPKHATTLVASNEKILDIGPFSGAFIAGAMQMVDTVVWNGTMGVSEIPAIHGPIGPFAQGTELVIDGLVGKFGHKPFSLIGGGDTTGYIEHRKMTDMFNHVSTGGGASLELMSGKSLPGVEVLWDK
jgi:3-phosphoglycerate kinase